MENKWCVYLITTENTQKYVGKTSVKNLRKRINSHKTSKRFKNVNFNYEILYETFDHDDVLNKETYYIEYYDTFNNGLNKTKTGKGCGHDSSKFTTLNYKFSEITKQKMREQSIKRKAGNKLQNWLNNLNDNDRKIIVKKMSDTKRNNPGPVKYIEDDVKRFIELYKLKPNIDNVGSIMKNGKILTYERAFAKMYSKKFNIPNGYNILKGKVLAWKHLL